MIKEIVDKELCCGCEACASICPRSAIEIALDDEGFRRPYIKENCIECRACQNVCPVRVDLRNMVLAYEKNAYYAATDDIAFNSTCSSGGIATALSIQFINNGGIVYGAAYSDTFADVIVKRIDNCDDLDCLKGAKYVQSSKMNFYKSIKEDLESGMKVLYIALPCEIAALRSYLKYNTTLLYTIDLICHGPTSLFGLRDYIDKYRLKDDPIIEMNMRYKRNNKWTPYYMHISCQDGTTFEEPFWPSDFGFLFARFARPSCYKCRFKGQYRFSDITIGDAWGAPNDIVEKNQSGLSMVIVNSPKGRKLFDSSQVIHKIEADYEMLVSGNPNIENVRIKEKERDSISKMLREKGLSETVKRNKTIRRRIFDFLRAIKKRIII